MAIDKWDNSAMTEGKMDTFNKFSHNTIKYKSILKTFRMDSRLASNHINQLGIKFNFIFIDGDHSFDVFLSDWVTYSAFLERNAIVAIHDIAWSQGVKNVLKSHIIPVTYNHRYLPNLFIANFK